MDFPADITLRKTRMKFWIDVQGCFVIQLSRFCVFFRKRLIILSHLQVLVKNFFQKLFLLFKKSVSSAKCELLYVVTQMKICQELFQLSFKIFFIFLRKMGFSCTTDIIISQQYMWVKLFLNKFYFSKKTLYTVLFLYFSFPTCSFTLIYCYFFIIIIDKSTTSFTKCKNDSAFLLRDARGCRAIVPTLNYWKT